MTEIAQIKMRTKKADHDAMSKALRGYMGHEYAHPELFHYTSTRFYFMDDPDNPDEEIWMCIHHFDDFDDYAASLDAARENDPVTQQHALAVAALLIGVPTRDRWIEDESLAVDMPPQRCSVRRQRRRRCRRAW